VKSFVLALCMLGSAAAAQPAWCAQAVAPKEAASLNLWPILCPPRTAVQPTAAELTAAIVQHGAAAAAPVLGILLGEIEEPELGYEIDPQFIEQRPQLLTKALQQLPRAAVIEAIDRASAGMVEVDPRLELCRILGQLGGREALDRIQRISASFEPIQWERTFVQNPIQDALANTLRAQPEWGRGLAWRVRSVPPSLGAIWVRAIARARASEASGALAQALGRDPKLDGTIAEALVDLAGRPTQPLPEAALASLRRGLDSTHEDVVRSCAAALARLGDSEAVERLIPLLDSSSAPLRQAAQSALVTLSGERREPKSEAWNAWWTAEREWYLQRFPLLLESFAGTDAALMGAAVTELLQHPVFRHQVAEHLLGYLDLEERSVVLLICAALPRLNSGLVLAPLGQLADQAADPLVREAATKALHALHNPESSAPRSARRKAL
jgi:hypothetical protein